ncbi:uncharacterized protein LOC135467665 isoform X2 [Liolophura sinensis]|uniref:uncharacterized protein LOC135467665 isoform X2 n=1 Tax=Liolophura sinensis TaxID=3198878 RepID=UPI0031592CD6
MYDNRNLDFQGSMETIVTSNGSGQARVEKLESCCPAGKATVIVVEPTEKSWEHQVSSSSSNPSSSPSTNKTPELPTSTSTLKRKRVLEKFVYMTSVLTLAFLVHALLTAQWLLPYYYAVSAPVLILVRVVLYWAVPDQWNLFSVVYSLANGPLLWAVVVYRNSLVFHSLDKVTSSFIHLLPTFLSFGVRWYSSTTSLYWYTSFIPQPLEPSWVWLVAVPLACFVIHSLIYSLIVNVILKPSDEYLTSYRYLTSREGTYLYMVFNMFGPRARVYMYTIFNWMFCLVTLLFSRLLFEFYIANCIALAFVVLVCIFNGASFYMDVFSVRGFQDEY